MILKVKDIDGNWVSVPVIRGEDGLTTSITLNGELIEQEDGNIDLGNLVEQEDGKGLSSNDYTDEDKEFVEVLGEKVTVSEVGEDGTVNYDGGEILSTIASEFTKNGYVKLSNGLILQWGSATSNSSGYAACVFPINFTTALFFAPILRATSTYTGEYVLSNGFGNSTGYAECRTGANTALSGRDVYWFALGI